MSPNPPKRAYLGSKIFFGHSTFKIELSALRSEASTEGIFSNKCLLLVEYKQFKKEEQMELHIAYWQPQLDCLFTGNKNFQSIIKLGFHHILYRSD